MKKNLFFAALVFAVAFMMQGCITNSVQKLRLATNESIDILNGTVFLIPRATVIYNDGTIFAFKENGKYQYIEDEDYIEITTPSQVISCDKYNMNYTIYEFDRDGMYSSEYLFPEALLRYEKTIERFDVDVNINETTMPVAGKSCVCFKDNNGETIAGWKRILMYEKDDYSVLEATKITEEADDKLFQIPEGYTLVEN